MSDLAAAHNMVPSTLTSIQMDSETNPEPAAIERQNDCSEKRDDSEDNIPAVDDANIEKVVEKGQNILERSPENSSIDPNLVLVTWDEDDDPANPRNWSRKKKWLITFLTSTFAFISPVSSSMVAPSLATIAKDFYTTNQAIIQINLSVFVLAYAIAPLILEPLSEVFGRRPVLQVANLEYLIFNSVCGAARNENLKEMIAFRFLAGLGGSVTLAIGGGIMSDMWTADERGSAVSVYSLMPLLGPAIGPIAGGYITQYWNWRWSFYIISIANVLLQFLATLYLKETYPRKLLGVKAKRIAKETGNPKLYTKFDKEGGTLFSKLKVALTRPIILIGTQPIVQALSLYMAFLYGFMYLVLSTFPRLWVGRYHESPSIGGWNYASCGIGFFAGTQICAPLMDRIYRKLKIRNKGIGRPEFRVPLMMAGSFIIPFGIFIYAWTAQYLTFWLWPNIGIFVASFGIVACFQGMQAYLIESYTQYAASATSAATVIRSLAAFGFPLFHLTFMIDTLGYGWGNSLLGFLAIGIGWPAPILLWKYGQRLREKSTFAAGGE